MATNYVTKFAKLVEPSSFIALVFRNKLEYHNSNGRVNSGNDPNTSCEHLVSFGFAAPEFTRRECVYHGGWPSSMRGRLGNARHVAQVAILQDNCHPSSCNVNDAAGDSEQNPHSTSDRLEDKVSVICAEISNKTIH